MSISTAPSVESTLFDDDDEEGWQDMPVVKEDDFAGGLDEEDRKKYHYNPSSKKASTSVTGNATGNLIDFDEEGAEWRTKADQNENEYTRLRVNEEDEADEVHLRTRYLFDEDKAMTPLSQMQATKNMLTESQRIAYVGLCALTLREMTQQLKSVRRKELKAAVQDMELWSMKIMGRLYYHMELETEEQKMIESLAVHGLRAEDLVPSLMTTHTVANPEYDPAEAQRKELEREPESMDHPDEVDNGEEKTDTSTIQSPSLPTSSPPARDPDSLPPSNLQTTVQVLEGTSVSSSALPGVTTSLSSTDKDVTLDIRWTVLCDLFLIIIADSVYDARSRVLLENVALKLGLGWLDVVKFESRVTEALEIQEGVEKMENQEIIEGSRKAARNKRFMMLGLATLGGGLVIGLSAGLLAPVIGAGLGAAFATVGITGTTSFLAGAGGAAVITTGGVLTGSSIAVRGMARRTRQVRIFDLLPLHNNKRVNCILTVPGFINGKIDDVRLPFSVLDPIVGDVFSVLWEPEMIQETGSALKILTTEVLTQIGQTVLQATVMTALMSALQWPIVLTKLGYLIDNPWNNALDRARAAGSVLAEVLMQRHLGVRPITLIGFSLGARVIFYALLEMAKKKAFGIVQDVFLLGATLTASTSTWLDVRSVISGRFVNAFAKNDWVLNYLFRATSGGLSPVAGLRPVENVPGLENVDVTDKIAGHMSYRTFMPLILDQLGFPVSSDFFDEPVEPEFTEERVIVNEDPRQSGKTGWFSSMKGKSPAPPLSHSRPPSTAFFASSRRKGVPSQDHASPDADLPPRLESSQSAEPSTHATPERQAADSERPGESSTPEIPAHAGFDFAAIKEILQTEGVKSDELKSDRISTPPIVPSSSRTTSTPLLLEAFTTLSESTSSLNIERSSTVTAQSMSHGLSSAFSRSLSMQDVRSEAEGDLTSRENSRMPSKLENELTRTSFNSLHSTPRHSPVPALSFPAGGESSWTINSAATQSTPPFGRLPSFSTDTLSYGNSDGLITSSRDMLGSSRLSYTPTSVMFGGADGTISPMEQDPWAASTNSSKKSGMNINPWSS